MVRDLYEALQVLGVGQYQRSHGETGSNDKSSRSHCFVNLEIKKVSTSKDTTTIKESGFTIVDLAGSERARNAKTAGERLAEGGHINKSLMFLGQCLEISTQNLADSKAKIPYRQSKLTELLFTNSYNPVTMPQLAAIIVTADPAGDFNATSQMLKYSALAKSSVNPRPPMQVLNGSRTVSTTSQLSAISGTTAISSLNENNNTQHQLVEASAIMLADLQRQLKLAEEHRKEMERKLEEANEKCFFIERSVREEVTGEMEKKMRAMERKFFVRMEETQEREEKHVDRKLDMLKKTMLSKCYKLLH